MSVYIVLFGRMFWVLVNIYYVFVMRGECLKEVYIVIERRYFYSLLKIMEVIKMILEVYGFFFEVKIFVILDDDFKEVDKVLKNFFFKLKEKDGDIVFNMIFGRKVLVVVVIIYSWELNVREIFYMVFFDV